MTIGTQRLRFLRGNTAAASAFTGLGGELIVDTGLNTIRVQDGYTPGGTVLATVAQLANVTANSSYSNSNVASYLTTYTGNIAANIVKNGQTWTFSNDGGFNMPDGAYIRDGLWWRAGGITLQAPSTNGFYTSVVSAYDNGVAYMATTGLSNDYYSGIFTNSQSASFTVSTGTGGPLSSWVFDGAGNLTLPNNLSAIKYANGTNILDGITGGNYSNVNVAAYLPTYNAAVKASSVNTDGADLTLSVGSSDWVFDETGVLTAPGEINTPGNITAWYFHGDGSQLTGINTSTNTLVNGAWELTLEADGDLAVPGNLIANIGGFNNAFNYLDLHQADTSVELGSSTHLNIISGSGLVDNSWTFDMDGNLVLPSNTSAINYANGTNILDGIAGSGSNYGNANVSAYLLDNPQPGTYSNANVAAYLLDNPQPGTYSNANIANYLPVYGGSVNANIITGTANATINGLTVNTSATVGSTLGVTGNIGTADTLNAVDVVATGTSYVKYSAGLQGYLQLTDDTSSGYVLGVGGSFNSWAGGQSINMITSSTGNIGFFPGQAERGRFTTTGFIVTGTLNSTGPISGGSTLALASNATVNALTVNNSATIGAALGVTGNITGNYFIGNGALLTGISASSNYGNANVAAFLANIGSNTIVTTGNITGGYFIGNGALLTGIVATGSTYSNTNVAAYLPVYGGPINANIITGTANATVNGLAVNTSVTVGTTLSATGGIQNTPIGNATPSTALFTTATTTGNLTANALTVNNSVTIGTTLGVTGNVIAGNLITSGTGGNISGVNFVFGNLVSTGNSTVQEFTVNSNATVGGTLGVTGTGTFAGNVTINGTQPGYAPNRPAFRIYGNTSSQYTSGTVIGSSSTSYIVDYNQGSYFNTTTGIFTAPVAGLYHASGTLRVGSYNGLNQASIQKNSSNTGANVVAFWETDTNTGTATHFNIGGYAKLAAGDTLRLVVVTGNINFDSNDSYGITYLG